MDDPTPAVPAPGRTEPMSPPISSQLERVLVVLPSWVGDTVMATPVLRALRRALPDTRLIGFARPGLSELLQGATWLDDLLVSPDRGPLGPLRAAALLRRERCQAALLLPNSFRVALMAALAGIPARIGYDRDGRRMLLTHKLAAERLAEPVPQIDYYLRLTGWALGTGDLADRRLELVVTPEEDEAADELLRGVDRPFVLLNPGGNRAPKRWPPQRFARTADVLRCRHGLASVVTGSPGERDVLRAVADAVSDETPLVNLAERGVGLGSLKAVIRRAALLITNDTGPRHIAAALGTPVVTLFGPTDHRWTLLPGVVEHVLRAEPFLADDQVADRWPRLCAISRIEVTDVVWAAEAVMKKPGGARREPA